MLSLVKKDVNLSEKTHKPQTYLKVALLVICIGVALMLIGLYTTLYLSLLGFLIFLGAMIIVFDVFLRMKGKEQFFALLILLASVTIILMFIVLTWRSGYPPPHHVVCATVTVSVEDGNYTINVTDITESVLLSNVRCTILNSTGVVVFKCNVTMLIGEQLDNEINVIFLDNDLDGNVSVGDQFKVKSKSYGGVGEQGGDFILEYRPPNEHGNVMCYGQLPKLT